ncbi:endonuclease III domain-containing protein [Flavobacterium daejeonense]|uniref:endonuclease III domain-containing protein n=1 Tax=Flavobacterium daejeonense TaxID=350893 RepID=UPI00047AD7E1|nr:DNA lyase [Flavobacterium daejeonense]
MNLFNQTTDWKENLNLILEKYSNQKHPLAYKNLYQLFIMVILSAQDSDENINKIAPNFFYKFPNIKSLTKTDENQITAYINKVKHHQNKAIWIINAAKIIKEDSKIPLTLKDLLNIKGIGRKSAGAILKEFNIPFEGIMTDLHVLRVAPRIGIIKSTKDGIKAEQLLMQELPREIWNNIGIALSFLGREICRPLPKCQKCPLNKNCQYPDKQLI